MELTACGFGKPLGFTEKQVLEQVMGTLCACALYPSLKRSNEERDGNRIC
jgi:hypothetical protein